MAYEDYLTPVLEAMRQRLVTMVVFPSVGLYLEDEPELVTTSRYKCNLQPQEGYSIPEQIHGAGRWLSGYVDFVSVMIYGQVALDRAWENTIQLTDNTIGLLTKAQEAFDALQLFMPLSGEGEPLTQEPIRLHKQSAPRPMPRNPQWCCVSLVFECRSAFNLDPRGPF